MPTFWTRTRVALLLCTPLLATSLASCGGPDPKPVARDLAVGLGKLDLSGVPMSGSSANAANGLKEITSGMDEIHPTVSVESVTESDDEAKATLHVRWPLSEDVTWSYDSTARLVRSGESWAVQWSPSTLVPGLDDEHRLVRHTEPADRGDITGAHDKPIVTERPVVRVGIDRTRVTKAKLRQSARALARLVHVDVKNYAQRVASSGDQAFVEAIVLRTSDAPDDRRLEAIPGARAIKDKLPLAPTREFAAPILGRVGKATAELVKSSHGRLAAGDVTGLSGLQQRYDKRLSGQKSVTIESVSTADGGAEPKTLFEHDATPGKPLRTTLDVGLQSEAEQALSDVGPASALVAIRPSDGNILAAASGPGGKGYSTATVGRYAPGSTFKIVSSLAMLRNGYHLNDKIPCPRTTTVNGKTFKNYDGYPSARLGQISMVTAIANSCNTAVISAHDRVSQSDLADAAASLGLGVDHDLGFPVFLGSVPGHAATTEHAASMIGQGKVQASPLAMAVVAASVRAGHTVVPALIAGREAPEPDAELSASQAEKLRRLMRAVVTEGSGTSLRDVPGPPVGAKTGTAEYGTADPPKTHAWMIATQGDLAVAVFVADGQSGSGTAGPILERFLRAAR